MYCTKLPYIVVLVWFTITVQLSCSTEENSKADSGGASGTGNDIDNTAETGAGSGGSSVLDHDASLSGSGGSGGRGGRGGSGSSSGAGGTDSTTTISSQCGNGQIETGEECESGVPIADTCQTLDKGNGTLSCDTTCQYDLSNCTDSATSEFTVHHEISSAIGTVGIVTWTAPIDSISEAFIEFGLDTNYGMQAPVDLDEPEYRTLLLGMKGSHDYHFRIVAKSGNTEYKSDDYIISTGPVTNLVQVLEKNIDDQNARAGGFIVTSLYQSGRSGVDTGTRGLAFIVDADGDIVWWASSSISTVDRARMSYDGKYMWMAPAGRIGNGIERVSMDGLDSRTFNLPATHDITAVSADVMAYQSGGSSDCVVITEITPDGTTKPVFDTAQVWQSGPCHANAIRYSEGEGVYTLSDLSQGDIIIVDRATGSLVNRISEFGFDWGGRQHGHHLLNDSIVFFNNGDRIVQEISLDRVGMQASEIWRYGSSYNSETLGDAQRLPNGNTMVTYSTAGTIHEVGPDSNRIMEIKFSASIGYSVWRDSLYDPPPDITL